MAGKHDGIDLDATVGDDFPPVFPGSKIDRAYSEGRQSLKQGGSSGDNPHPASTPEFSAWATGFTQGSASAFQIQTCWV